MSLNSSCLDEEEEGEGSFQSNQPLLDPPATEEEAERNMVIQCARQRHCIQSDLFQ